MKIKYESFDGVAFDTEAACREHEANNFTRLLVGLTIEQVEAALSRTDVALADAFEKAGSQIAKARRESGDLRRARKGGGQAAAAPTTDAEDAHLVHPSASGDELLDAAHTMACAGRKSFDPWYNGLNPDQIDELSPYMSELMKTAREAA